MIEPSFSNLIKSLLKTDLFLIFKRSEDGFRVVFPEDRDLFIPADAICFKDEAVGWFTPDEWSEIPLPEQMAELVPPGEGVNFIPYADHFILSPSGERVRPEIAMLIQDSLHSRERENRLKNMLFQIGHREETLFELHQRLTGDVVLERLLEDMLLFIKDSLGYHNCAILLLNDEATCMTIAASIGYPEEVIRNLRITLNTGITGWAASRSEIVIVDDVTGDSRYIPGARDARSELAIPLRVHGRVIGVLDVESEQPGFFTENDRRVLEPFGNILAVAIENARLFKALQESNIKTKEMFIQIVEALAEAIEAKDPYTRGHTKRSAFYAEGLARFMKMDEEEVENVKLACILHDVGKIGIPGDILKKKDNLTGEEMKIMMEHTRIGVHIIRGITQLQGVIPYIYSHHERYDGAGYPDRSSGSEIPLGARIVAVVDAYDAMTADRPYRKSLSREKALSELRREAGCQFDPDVVESLIRWLGDCDDESILTGTGCGKNP